MAPSDLPTISKREWFRWTSQEPAEPTDTLVLTSPKNRFVDIRIFKDRPGHNEIPGIRSLAQLDWAFAGFSSSEPSTGQQGQAQTHSVWKHFVDSRTRDAESVKDEGDMVPTLGSQTLEMGSMLDPATGQVTAYEECWSDIHPTPTPLSGDDEGAANVECAVLELQNDKHSERGMVVRVGQFCQGVIRVEDRFALERWAWTKQGGWKRVVRMGDIWMPCGLATGIEKLELDGKVTYCDHEWTVVELNHF